MMFDDYSKEQVKLLAILSGVMMLAIFAANIAAVKLWDLWGIAVDGGLIIFPLTYVVGDILVELYGQKMANFVSIVATIANVIIIGLMVIVVMLPAYPNWNGQTEFQNVVFSSLRITAASLIGFLFSQLTNNMSFRKIKYSQWQRQRIDEEEPYYEDMDVRHYKTRALLSSMLGRLVDNALFETIAFLGVLSTGEFLLQAVMAYVEGFVVEFLLIAFVSQPLVRLCRRYTNTDCYSF